MPYLLASEFAGHLSDAVVTTTTKSCSQQALPFVIGISNEESQNLRRNPWTVVSLFCFSRGFGDSANRRIRNI